MIPGIVQPQLLLYTLGGERELFHVASSVFSYNNSFSFQNLASKCIYYFTLEEWTHSTEVNVISIAR